jgi:ATP-dependent DNA ligase
MRDCEGIVSKRLGSIYRRGRSPLWVKVKNPNAPAVKRARLRRIGGADRGRQETRVTTIALSRSRTYLEMNNKRRL